MPIIDATADRSAELLAWFDAFAACVRLRDMARAEALFAEDVVAFGTRNEILYGRAALRDVQWRPTWEATRDFDFVAKALAVRVAPSGDFAWGAGRWTSFGKGSDGGWFERSGRATFTFAYRAGWRCTHSHLSLSPTGAL